MPTSPPIGGRKDADFQSINYQLTVFLQHRLGSTPAKALEVCIYYVRLRLSIGTSVRSLRSLATPNGDARSRLPQPKGFGLFSQEKL